MAMLILVVAFGGALVCWELICVFQPKLAWRMSEGLLARRAKDVELGTYGFCNDVFGGCYAIIAENMLLIAGIKGS